MVVKYSFQDYDSKNMARSSGKNIPISLKKTVETARVLQGRKVENAIAFLEGVIEKKTVVAYRKYRAEMGHKRGKRIDTGGYPVNVAKALLKLVKSAQKNGEERELGSLIVASISARKGAGRYHYGRYSGRQMKSTNVEVVLSIPGSQIMAKKAIFGSKDKKSDVKKVEEKTEVKSK